MTRADLLLLLYRALTTAGGPIIDWRLAQRVAQGKEDPMRLAERRGEAGRARPPGPLVWLHAASVGEAQSGLPLVDRLIHYHSELHVLVTTGTVASAELLAQRLPARAFHQYVPIDRLGWVRRFLDHWRPDMGLWLESELWPNLIAETRARSITMALVNARLSARSHARWRRARGLSSRLLGAFDATLAQDPTIASRLSHLRARNVVVTGTLKYAGEPLPCDPVALTSLTDAVSGRKCWLAASIHPGEDDAVFAAHRDVARTHPQLLTIIVPRHPARCRQFADAAGRYGLSVALRSLGELPAPGTDVYIADTMGELGLLYRLAPACFVGGSLVPHGGQNIFEPARLDCAITHGPHMHNFAAVAEEFASADAATQVGDAQALAVAISSMLGDEERRDAMCRSAQQVAAGKRDVLDRVMTILQPLLPAELQPISTEMVVRARA